MNGFGRTKCSQCCDYKCTVLSKIHTYNIMHIMDYNGTLLTQTCSRQHKILVNLKAENGPHKAPSIPNCADNIKF